jgi:hypothetical protein
MSKVRMNRSRALKINWWTYLDVTPPWNPKHLDLKKSFAFGRV